MQNLQDRGFAKGTSRTLSPQLSKNETAKHEEKGEKPKRKQGKNGERKKTEIEKRKNGSDSVPATPSAKSRPMELSRHPPNPGPRNAEDFDNFPLNKLNCKQKSSNCK